MLKSKYEHCEGLRSAMSRSRAEMMTCRSNRLILLALLGAFTFLKSANMAVDLQAVKCSHAKHQSWVCMYLLGGAGDAFSPANLTHPRSCSTVRVQHSYILTTNRLYHILNDYKAATKYQSYKVVAEQCG